MKGIRAGIALGSNVGERLSNLQAARAELAALFPGPLVSSSIYETDPVDCEQDAPAFLNAVVEIEHPGPAIALMDALQALEAGMGRPSKRPRNAPRTIDLDILYFGNLVLRNEELMVPHPRLHQRRFVLEPLAEIRPALVLPGYDCSIKELLARLPESPRVNLIRKEW